MVSDSHPLFSALCRRFESRLALSQQEAHAVRSLTAVPRRLLPPGSSLDVEPRRCELLLSGLACRYTTSRSGRRQIIAYLVPGDFCSSDICDPKVLGYQIGTLSAVMIASLPREGLTQIGARFPRLSATLQDFTVAEAATTTQWLLNLGQRDALERTSHLLCELFIRLNCVGLTSANGCELPLKQTDLADALVMSPVHMSRTLMKLRRLRLAHLLHKWLTLYDFEELKTVAGFTPTYLGIRELPRAMPAIPVSAPTLPPREDTGARPLLASGAGGGSGRPC
jgi:CRP-like cAMP-binding protein